jgi:hypothetical protein
MAKPPAKTTPEELRLKPGQRVLLGGLKRVPVHKITRIPAA